MPASFFFYDLETSGISAVRDRIMQFAGQRTDQELKALGKPFNISVQLSKDILPSPEAILVSGISPLDNLKTGITEAEFSELFNNKIALAGTIFTGFNNVRFDDEFIRYNNYRNFYDAYSWHWQDSSSRWDLLDVIRMTRALRPEGINWPTTDEGKATNRLELLTKANKLAHANAHDALSDTLATIEVAKLLKSKQPKLFDYLLNLRKKAALIELINNNDSLIYTSSHYSSEVLHTTVIYILSFDSTLKTAQVVDLREDVGAFVNLSIDELVSLWEYNPKDSRPRLPIKTRKLNRCPAVAPLSVLDKESISRLNLDMPKVESNRQLIVEHKTEFASKLKKVAKRLDEKRDERLKGEPRIPYADERLYDKFITKSDAAKFTSARQLAMQANNFEIRFEDNRLNQLYELYRARNYQNKLTYEEREHWHEHVKRKLFYGHPSMYQLFLKELSDLRSAYKKDKSKLVLLKDLEKYAQSILSGYESDLPAMTA